MIKINNSYFVTKYKKRVKSKKILISFISICFLSVIIKAASIYYQQSNSPSVIKTVNDYNNAVENDSYVNINTDDIYDLDIVKTTTTKKLGIKVSENVSNYFVGVKVDERFLIVSISPSDYDKFLSNNGPYTIKGSFDTFSQKDLDTFKDEFIKLGFPVNNIDSIMYPSYLKYETPLDNFILFIFPLIIILIPILVIIFIIKKNNRLLKGIVDYCNKDIDTLSKEVDKELMLPNVYINKALTITENYMIIDNAMLMIILPLNQLIWAYKTTTTKKIYGIINAGESHNGIIFVLGNKNKFSVTLPKKSTIADETLEYLSKLSNKPLIGFNKDLQKLFKKNPDEFIRQYNEMISDEN